MSKASEDELAALHGAVARGLTEVIAEGVTVGISEDGEPTKATAGAAYFMAALTMLKNNNITADAGANADLAALGAALAAKRKAGKTSLQKAAIEAAAEEFDKKLGGMTETLQ